MREPSPSTSWSVRGGRGLLPAAAALLHLRERTDGGQPWLTGPPEPTPDRVVRGSPVVHGTPSRAHASSFTRSLPGLPVRRPGDVVAGFGWQGLSRSPGWRFSSRSFPDSRAPVVAAPVCYVGGPAVELLDRGSELVGHPNELACGAVRLLPGGAVRGSEVGCWPRFLDSDSGPPGRVRPEALWLRLIR